MRNQPPSFIDPLELANLANLELIARTAVLGFRAGRHRSLKTGASAEFEQYRPYTQGDDPRHVDWRLFGRTDRLHIKEFQDETNLRCTVVLDCSASMDYGSGKLTKFRYAQMLAATLLMMLTRQHDAAGLLAYHSELLSHIPSKTGGNHLHRMIVELEKLRPAGETDTAGILDYAGNILPSRGMVVLISDLIHPLDLMLTHLRSLRARRHDVMVLQIADEAELTFPFEKPMMMQDAESGRERQAVPQFIREQYLENRQRHFDAIKTECLASEIDIQEFVTREPLDHALMFFTSRRNQTLITASRRSGQAARGGR